MRARLLPAAVLAALVTASIAALASPAPPQLPSIALGAVVVWRVEVAAVVFLAAYGAVVATRLALHGETLTRVGRDGIEIPRVRSIGAQAGRGDEDLAASIAELQAAIADLTRTSRDPSDVVLRPNREDT